MDQWSFPVECEVMSPGLNNREWDLPVDWEVMSPGLNNRGWDLLADYEVMSPELNNKGCALQIDYEVMSPGFDNWRRELHYNNFQSSQMHLHSEHRVQLPVERNNASTSNYGNEQSTGLQVQRESAQDQGPQGRAIAGDREYHAKAMRPFKFALVEYLKEQLRPHWREGKISYDIFKIIVRKSADKVIKSFETSEFPSRRNIHSYLNSSHSKLSKLIQAYVDKYQKR